MIINSVVMEKLMLSACVLQKCVVYKINMHEMHTIESVFVAPVPLVAAYLLQWT